MGAPLKARGHPILVKIEVKPRPNLDQGGAGISDLLTIACRVEQVIDKTDICFNLLNSKYGQFVRCPPLVPLDGEGTLKRHARRTNPESSHRRAR